MIVIAATVGIAVAAALVGASLVNGERSAAPAASKTVAMAPQTAALLHGIPQHGATLGSPTAPVTLVEYADLQCPYCGEFARTTLPMLIRDYVRTGKVKLVFHGLEFVGPDSDTALRAVYAAGRQNRLWSYADLMFENQGTENTGWVTEDLITSVAAAVPGLDGAEFESARRTSAVAEAIATSGQSATAYGVTHTPWFQVGRTGAALQTLATPSLDAAVFSTAFDRLLRR